MAKTDQGDEIVQGALGRLKNFRNLYDPIADTFFEEFAKRLHDAPEISQASSDVLRTFFARGGKRARGCLAYVSYKMFGGQDESLALTLSHVIELIHAAILIDDDVADRSGTRRGGPTVHKIFEDIHRERSLAGDVGHFGEAMAIHAAVLLKSVAFLELERLQVSQLPALQHELHQTIVRTMHGQLADIYFDSKRDVSENDIEYVLRSKTGYYTFLSPLRLGGILAGASEEAMASLEYYALPAGMAFQLQDDIIGLFGEAQKSGKSNKDDLREGKMTLLMHAALRMATQEEQTFLRGLLGADTITDDELESVQCIVRESGALNHVLNRAQGFVDGAVQAVEALKIERTDQDFLRGIAQYAISRET